MRWCFGGSAAQRSAWVAALGVVAGLAAGVTPAAGSTYQISGEGDDYFTLSPYTFQEGAFGKTSNVPVSNSVSRDNSGTYPGEYRDNLDEFAAADQAGAHVSTVSNELYAFAKGSSDEYFKFVSQASAMVTIDDLIISGSPTAATVPTAVHMKLDGSLLATSELNDGSQGVSALTSISASLSFGSQLIGSGSASVSSANGSTATHSSSAWLSGYTGGDVTLTSATFDAPVNTPFTLQFELSASSTTQMNEDDFCAMIANTDFGDTFGFSTDQAVFSLPAGYTADSASAGIVANQTVSAPEPGTASLLVAALFMTARPRRSRRA